MKALSIALALLSASAAAAEPFTLISDNFMDGQPLSTKFAGKAPGNPNCIGENISPQLSWTNAPVGTRSFAIMMIDLEGRAGLGVDHWIAYGLPASMTSLAEGEASRPPKDFVGGKNTAGLPFYLGPCPPRNAAFHHYNWVLIATDLDPQALPPGLTRPELIEKLTGHTLASTGLVGLFKHP